MKKANPADMKLLISKDFNTIMRKLVRKGGVEYEVHKQVQAALVRWNDGVDPQLNKTHHGESRIPHVVKYDLRSYFRLVVYEHAGKRVPLYVGNHNDTQSWLDAHRGCDFTVNEDSNRVQFTYADVDGDTTEAAIKDVDVTVPARGPILEELPNELVASIGIPEATLRALNSNVTYESVDEGHVWELIQALTFPSEEHRNIVMQSVALVAKGQIEQACETISVFSGRAKTATDAPGQFSDAIDSGDNTDVLVDVSELTKDEMDLLLSAEGLADWMLYLHPDQKREVQRDYNGPARVIGVSGSGKTSVLVHRANRLAKEHPGLPILILSLNAALCRLISTLLDDLCGPGVRGQISVKTIYEYCYQAVKTIDPDRLIERQDPISGENLAICWQDFLKKPHALDSVAPLIDVLEAREDAVDGSAYVLDELIWIRSGFGVDQRELYLTCDRPGRGIGFPRYTNEPSDGEVDHGADAMLGETGKGIPRDVRPRLLRLLDDYEEYMRAGGLLDDDGVSLDAFDVRQRIHEHEPLRARHVLVDEVQDCSTVELAVIAEIPTDERNGLFLTGDPVQKVFAKQHDLVDAGISIVGRGTILRRNYRNTRQILESAYEIIDYFREMSPLQAQDVLEPEYAFRDGPRPSLYECGSREEQAELVMCFLSWLSPDEFDATCIGTNSLETLEDMESRCSDKGLPVFRITSESARAGKIGSGIKLALLQDLKGFEFRQVYLLDLMDSRLIPRGMPYEERWRSAFQLYVAMTRARDELTMSYVYNRSILLSPLGSSVSDMLAADLLAES